MGKPFAATRAVVLEDLPRDYVLTEAEVVAAIAHHISQREEEVRSDLLRGRVRKRLTYVPKKKERQITCISPGKYTAAEALRWAQQHFAIWFSDIPGNVSFVGSHSGYALTSRVVSFPVDIESCHRAILEADRRIAALEGALATAKRRIAEIEPLAVKYEENRVTNRSNAQKKRGK